jgi:glucosamine 6-phosphate synthetase-like amidotransferase/phosphosugar isomerase protein
MCGIAGYSLRPESPLDVQHVARVLLASVAERGADAAGCAWANPDGSIELIKQPGGASTFLEELVVPSGLRQILIHVRDQTKGRPSLAANNHPIRHGRIVGIHNGRIENDDQLFAELGRDRAEPGMTVDSEAIFALLDHEPTTVAALERLKGSFAVGWFDGQSPDTVQLARGFGRPLWLASSLDGDLFWTSTLEALEIVEEFVGIELHKRPVRAGTALQVRNGTVIDVRRFDADRRAEWLRNPVASPDERRLCLKSLAG